MTSKRLDILSSTPFLQKLVPPNKSTPLSLHSTASQSPSEKAPVLMKRFLKAFRSQPTPEPKSAEDVWVDRMKTWFDPMVYTILFLIGLPLFFTPGGHQRSLPLFLATVSLAWLFSRRVIPGPWQKILHPILVTSGITILSFGSLVPSKVSHYPKVSVIFHPFFSRSRLRNPNLIVAPFTDMRA